MNKETGGITLTEVLVVIAIIALLSALLFPVFKNVKKAAKITKSISNMRQLHQAINIYMGEDMSTVAGQGLPTDLVALRNKLELPESIFHTGGNTYYGHPGNDVYAYMAQVVAPGEERGFMVHVQKTHGNPILLVDGTQNNNVNFDIDIFESRLGIGLFYDGHVEKRHHSGSSNRFAVWE